MDEKQNAVPVKLVHGDEACGVCRAVPYAVKQLGVRVVVEVVVQLQLIHMYPHLGHP